MIELTAYDYTACAVKADEIYAMTSEVNYTTIYLKCSELELHVRQSVAEIMALIREKQKVIVRADELNGQKVVM